MTIVVTGGTKGIGLAIAERLAQSGKALVLGFVADDAAAAAARERLNITGAKVSTVRADVGEIEGAVRLMQHAADVADGDPLQIVHSAATIYPTSLLDADLGKFTHAIQVNGLALLYLVRAALPQLSRGSGVVLISSAGARTPQANCAALGAGKALAESLVRYLVAELAPRGVRVNAVAPGLVETTSVATMLGSQEAASRLFERAARANPSGRLTQDNDYAAVVEFLLSPAAEFVQGQVIHVNGGAYVPS
jgi:NAD(P)-dependent dehydrogenase (short-subunit alcohol dehydrogenase family)